MGKQFNFLMDREMEEEFVNYVLTEGKVIFEGNNLRPQNIKVLPKPFSERGWFQVCIYKAEYGELILDKTSNIRQFIDSSKSPVIEFIRTVVRDEGKEISRGRLWIEMKYYDENGDLQEKNKDLNNWYISLCKWIRKRLTKTEIILNDNIQIEYVSPTIKYLIEKGYKII